MSTDTDSVELVDDRRVGYIAQAALIAAFIGSAAHVSFPLPFSSVPVTLQVLGVFLAGIALGPVWGPISIVLYLTMGAIGLPVYAGGEGGDRSPVRRDGWLPLVVPARRRVDRCYRAPRA
jgi:biotin transport system substrate-specific component